MELSQLLLILVHIAAAATAFGVLLSPSGALKRARAAGSVALTAAAGEVARAAVIAAISDVVAFATGLGLIFTRGGFAAHGPPYHAAMGLVLVMAALAFFFVRGQAQRLAAGGDAAGIKKIAMGSGILQLLWLTTLVLMFARYL